MTGERSLTLALVTLWLASCGGRSETEAGPKDAQAFFAEYQAALCEASARCCPELANPLTCGNPLPASLALVSSEARPELYVYRADAAVRCLAAIRAASICDAGPLPISCHSVFEGQLAAGEPCQAPVECRPPAKFAEPVCASAVDGSQVCGGALGLGEPCRRVCANDGACYPAGGVRGGACYLSSGLYCPINGDDSCNAVGEVGAACSNDFACSSEMCGPAGECLAPLPLGAACGDRIRCALGLYCDHQRCAAQVHAPHACNGEGCFACFGAWSDDHCSVNTVVCAH